MSDVIIDTFKMVKDPPKRQSEVQTNAKAAKTKPVPAIAAANTNSVAQK